MKSRFALVLAVVCASCAPQAAADKTVAAWEQRAQSVTIVRDNWGIAHVRGKSDADAVFGAVYAQAEDDFNRIETNYVNAMGRLAEAEGDREIYRDLRMKLFIDPDDMKAKYQSSPDWLKALMNAWADGLNYFLHTHPSVKPKVIKTFEPWMALTFSEGSIGGDIERINIGDLEAFYGGTKKPSSSADDDDQYAEPGGSNGIAVAPANTTAHHALLLINPHTSFFFR
jgi:acyl-homoserine-lactone acylase